MTSFLKTDARNPQRNLALLIGSIAAISGLLFGFDTGVIAGAQVFIQQSLNPSTLMLEMIVSATVLGAFLGALCSGRLADRLGRRTTLMLTACCFMLGTILCCIATNSTLLITGRLILGIAIGVASYTAPLFISEIAPPHRRGAMVLLNGIAITGGQCIAFFSDYLLSTSGNWHLMIGLGLLPAALLLFGMLLCPSSPRWLLLVGRRYEALTVLRKIRSVPCIQSECDAIETNLQEGKQHKRNWRMLFSKKIRPVLIIGLGLGILQQLMGINTVMYYGPTIFQHIGFTLASHQILGTLALGCVNLAFTVVAILLVDRIGRKPLLIAGTLVATLSLGVLTLLAHSLQSTHASPLTSCLCFMFLITYIAGYSASIGTLFWLVIAEIFPLHVRGLAMSFVTGIQWAANFLVSMTFISLLHAAGIGGAFATYAVLCLVACIFCWRMVPETKGISLEAIEHNLKQGLPARKLGQTQHFQHAS